MNVEEKSRQKIVAGEVQGDERKGTDERGIEILQVPSKLGATNTPGRVQGDPAYCLDGARHIGGVNLNQARHKQRSSEKGDRPRICHPKSDAGNG
ncbi:MAG: hypothetical protein JRJ47_07740 [Deltaproteobacteria bacterium]|nr:hypothetical protein [Deltaproteobacteria bacterium]